MTAHDTLDLRSVADGADVIPKEPAKDEKPLVERELQFTVIYVTPEGKRHQAVLTSCIMSGPDRARRDRLCGASAGGPWQNLPPAAQTRIWMQMTVAIQLVDPPDWLLEAVDENYDLLSLVYEEVEGHSLRWFRGDDGKGNPAPLEARMELVSHDAAARKPG